MAGETPALPPDGCCVIKMGVGKRIVAGGLLAILGTFAVAAESPSPVDNPMRVVIGDSVVSVQTGERVLMRYRYQDVPFKPYVEQLFTPLGVNVLRDAPHDHLHHHALMFAVAVDGVNFWEETETAGRQVHKGLTDVRIDAHNDVPWARYTELIDWINPRSEEMLVTERRTIEVPYVPDMHASLLTWHSSLEIPPGKESVSLTGSHYFGLGMRFLESMDARGKFLDGGTESVEVVRGDERNFRSTWCAYTAEADGKPVTAAMFDHPDNPRHPATWFTMAKPFAYLSATLNLHKEPLKVMAGKPLHVRYGVALWDGRVEAAEIDRVYRWWVGWVPAREARRQE
jgi:hypothetical protein